MIGKGGKTVRTGIIPPVITPPGRSPPSPEPQYITSPALRSPCRAPPAPCSPGIAHPGRAPPAPEPLGVIPLGRAPPGRASPAAAPTGRTPSRTPPDSALAILIVEYNILGDTQKMMSKIMTNFVTDPILTAS